MTQTSHTPVLLGEIIKAILSKANGIVVDATFGAGGYTRAFLEEGARVFAFDRDPHAIALGKKLTNEFGERLTLIHAPFSQMKEELAVRGAESVDAVVFDFGVSSMQIDEAERGFSFRHDGPLDMRMSGEGVSAADLVNTLGEKELADILYRYGEEKRSRVIARAIAAQRATKKFTRTLELAELIEKTIGRRPQDRIHPATRSFQALRVAVNEELEEITQGLAAASQLLHSGGMLAAVTFHSLEDRIVKQFLKVQGSGSRHAPETRLTEPEWRLSKLVVPSEQEMAANPRARSAKLRIAEKI